MSTSAEVGPRVQVGDRRRTLTAVAHLPLLDAQPRTAGTGPDTYLPELLVITYRLDTSSVPYPWHWVASLSGPILRPSGATRRSSGTGGREAWQCIGPNLGPAEGATVAPRPPRWVVTQVRHNRPFFPQPED